MIKGTEVDVNCSRYVGRAAVQDYHGDEVIVVQPIGKKGTPLVVTRRDLKVIEKVEKPRHPVVRKSPWPFVVGLAGPKKVGKSTTADALEIALKPLQMRVASFAGPLYESISAITGIPVPVLKDQRIKDRPLTTAETSNPCLVGKTIREILEWQGEGIRQFLGIDHWVHRAFSPLPEILGIPPSTIPGGVIVFDDARHGPEFEATDINFELEREGCSYPCNHPSAMPPDPTYIAEKISLNGRPPQQVGEHLATQIINAMRAKGLEWS